MRTPPQNDSQIYVGCWHLKVFLLEPCSQTAKDKSRISRKRIFCCVLCHRKIGTPNMCQLNKTSRFASHHKQAHKISTALSGSARMQKILSATQWIHLPHLLGQETRAKRWEASCFADPLEGWDCRVLGSVVRCCECCLQWSYPLEAIVWVFPHLSCYLHFTWLHRTHLSNLILI